ncbi:putative Alpha-(1,3)-fucosyltransferase C [Hypsibius exemplaris]|uniref:Fucosyltransferase n=1 Tax=Hypsibius exemplaris TaxID=2072580 RepID=A0A1W0XB79_HYPEX|nr:putative Alpha-(1,3)-fucosyltransferase C [Hypsibius exemplaris]
MLSCNGEHSRLKSINSAFTLIVFLGCCFSGLFYRESRKNAPEFQKKTPFFSRKDTEGYKKILFWTAWNAQRMSFSPNNQPDWLDECPESRCLFVSSKKRPQDADAVFFSMPDLYHFGEGDLPGARTKDQYYIFHLDESPDTTKELMPWHKWGALDNFFNLTMTYRRDSDIFSEVYLSGYEPHIMNLTTRGTDPLWFEGKRDILWLVSHCHTASKREEYVRRLSHYLKVDEYGKCDAPDPCRTQRKNCDLANLVGKYKFYLSFENSFCNEYVTEKLTRALNTDVVPIVLGGANYSSFLPKSAVINIEDFASPKNLAKYLESLMENVTLYESHLSWKYPGQPLWTIPGTREPQYRRFCKLCEILHRPPEQRIEKIYPSVKDWWFDGQCREPRVPFKRAQHSRNEAYLQNVFVDTLGAPESRKNKTSKA